MNPIFAYLIKSSVSLAILYCLFRFVMRNDRNHTINRFLLLGILFVSAIIPFPNIQFFYEEVQLAPVEFVREFVSSPVPAEPALSTETIQPVIQSRTIEINYWLLFYSVIILLLTFRLLFGILQVSKIIKKAEKKRLQKIVLAVVKDFIQPFTFLNKVVLSEKDFNENKDIVVAHEHAHIKYMHALDLMVCELFTVVQFFNPFMWLLRRDLKLVHEYQADEAVLKKGIDAQKYQLLVLEKAVGEKRFAMASHFTQKPILKRLTMMQKNKTNSLNKLKVFLFVLVLILLITAFSETNDKVLASNIIPEKIISQSEPVFSQSEYEGFSIELRKDDNYIDNKLCSLEEVVTKANAWQKTGREDILLILDEGIPLSRIDEVRMALSNAKVYHVNQKSVNSDEIIYPHGDVSKGPKLTQGNWREWWTEQLKIQMKGIPEDLEYRILYSFIIDKNGKVSDGHVVKGCKHPEINEAYNKALAKIPDWKPAEKGAEVISVYCTYMDGR